MAAPFSPALSVIAGPVPGVVVTTAGGMHAIPSEASMSAENLELIVRGPLMQDA